LFRRCRYRDEEVFRDFKTSEPPQFGASHFPLLPYSNRIRNGRFEFDGKTVALSNSLAERKHVLHGLGWIKPWNVNSATSDKCSLHQRHDGENWPWAYAAEQNISVRRQHLRLELSLTNEAKSSMPCGLGFHPFFPDLDTAWIAFDSSGVWLAGEDVLPTSHIATSPGFDFSRPQRLKDYQLDHCFTGTKTAEINWKDSEKTIKIESSENLGRAAVYTAHDVDSFCFEPVSHTHNAVNMGDPISEGTKFLAPGETMTVWSTFTVALN